MYIVNFISGNETQSVCRMVLFYYRVHLNLCFKLFKLYTGKYARYSKVICVEKTLKQHWFFISIPELHFHSWFFVCA